MHKAPPFPQTAAPALRSLLSVALSSDTVKSTFILALPDSDFKYATGRSLRPGLAGNYDLAGRRGWLYAFRKLFREISPKVMINGILPGHLKGVIRCGSGICALSVTREDAIDETISPEWEALNLVEDFDITINLLSIFPVTISREELEAALNTFLFSQ